MKPTFCIIGAQKAGSTFLQSALGCHPEIFVVPQEVPFFEDPDYAESRWHEFESIFDQAAGHRAVGFKRPDYLAMPESALRLKRHLPNLRLLVILRDPVSRAVSALFHYARFGLLPIIDVNEGMARILSGELQRQYPAAERVIRYSLYHEGIKTYLELFPASHVGVYLMDDIKSDPLNAALGIYRLLGVSETSDHLQHARRANEGVYHPSRVRFLRAAMKLRYDNLSTISRLRERRLGVVSGPAYAAMRTFDKYVLSNIYDNRAPQLSPSIRRALHERFDSDVAALELLLGRDLSAWKSPD